MYAAVRPALRSATRARPPARFIRGRRYPLAVRIQAFHTSRSLAQAPNPPPSSDDTPEAEKNVGKATREKAEAAATVEQADNAAVPEDPEVIAQKLQRSKEVTRRYSAALRRTQRRNRAQDLPPIHVPNWFLDECVKLREDIPPQHRLAELNQCRLSLHHIKSGEKGTCLVPLTSYPTTAKSLSFLTRALWKKGMSEEQRKQLARDFTKRLGRGSETEASEAVETPPESTSSAPDEGVEDNIGEQAAVEGKEMEPQAKDRRKSGSKSISPLLYAEVRATVAASLSTLHPSINESFASSKSNLILHSPSTDSDHLSRQMVRKVASELGADVVTLDAQDLAQIAGDYLGEGPEPTPNSIRSLGYETYKLGPDLASDMAELSSSPTLEADQGLNEDGQEAGDFNPLGPNGNGIMPDVKVHFVLPPAARAAIKNAYSGFGYSTGSKGNSADSSGSSTDPQSARAQSQAEIQLEDLKLSTLLEALVDSPDLKRGQAPSTTRSKFDPDPSSPLHKVADKLEYFQHSFFKGGAEYDFSAAMPPKARDDFKFLVTNGPPVRRPELPAKPKIVYIPDIKELNATDYGNRIMHKLEDIVRKQRSAGQSVMILGSTSSLEFTPELSPNGIQGLQSEEQAGSFRTIVITAGNIRKDEWTNTAAATKEMLKEVSFSAAEKSRIYHINLRHIQDMLRCLDPASTSNIADRNHSREQLRFFASVLPRSHFWSVLTWDQVHRIALTALGLHLLDPVDVQLSWAHVALAMGLLKASDEVKNICIKSIAAEQQIPLKERYRDQINKLRESMGQDRLRGRRDSQDAASSEAGKNRLKRSMELKRISATANHHEKRLLHGVVDPFEIKTTFDNVHVPKETIEAIRTLTSLSLLRPDAFDYGVLAMEKISGALLYGPPGTGKTLLAKAVAKESGCAVLEVSGSQIMDKYVGEGEKNVAAIFSLAQKLSPCIVFLDEADAIFGTRDAARERTAHRDILNQFLKEWDGLNNVSVFVMVATNRPFDMDDAVIRRLPRRLLVDLPTEQDRKKILEIHLKDEQIDSSIDLDDLAKRTPLYSGSDLKNVAVFAALACVREENEQAAIAAVRKAAEVAQSESQDGSEAPEVKTWTAPILVQGQKYDFPERRTLHMRHFEKALQEVSASISEDMSSLNAIKKFDEQYGDRKGKRKKTAFGFGGEREPNEEAARVRI